MIISRRILVFVVTMLVFFAGMLMGFSKAVNKPLWGDEIYTQKGTIQDKSWTDILTGHTAEGNNSPLFYVVQRLICDLVGYKPYDIEQRQFSHSRYILRIFPVVCMSLGISIIFWFFCEFYSWIAGFISLILSLSSYMVWYYWAEARPYALIFMVTTIQSFSLLYYYHFDKKSRGWRVGIVNILLSLITSISVIQIAASAVVFWIKGERRAGFLLVFICLPLMIAIGYYLKAVHYSFHFLDHGHPFSLIKANVPAERLIGFFILPIVIWLWDRKKNNSKEFVLWPFFIWGWLTFIGYVMLLGCFFIMQKYPREGFEVSNRYLMSLTPIGIIVFTTAVIELIKRPQSLRIKIIVWAVAGVLILSRINKLWSWLNNI